MNKYEPDTDHWDEQPETESEWRERTSADIEIEVTLHDEGYQTDRKWTVHVYAGYANDPHDPREAIAGFAAEHHNKGNFWRPPKLWRDAIDFVDLPRPVRERVAVVLNRPLDDITPAERSIQREDGEGLLDREREWSGRCEVCGGRVFGDDTPTEDPLVHPHCEVAEL